MQVISNAEAVVGWLQQQSNVMQVTAVDQLIRFQLATGAEDKQQEVALLLKGMIQQDFQVVDFTSEGRTLEDVFMQITTGAVQ